MFKLIGSSREIVLGSVFGVLWPGWWYMTTRHLLAYDDVLHFVII